MHVCDWYSTFVHLAGGDSKDSNTVGTRPDGSEYALPGVDSMNMWGVLSGVERSSPRTELPLVIDHPTSHNAALIVGDYKLLLGTTGLAYWQGNAFPNGTDCAPGTPDNECTAPYKGSFLSADCGDIVSLEGGCLYNIRTDPHETVDVAAKMPDVLHSIKARYLELRATMLNQTIYVQYQGLCGAPNASAAGTYAPVWEKTCLPWAEATYKMLQRNKGFIGPYMSFPPGN